MEKKLFAIECENVALVVRPNGDTVIVTEATELVLNNAVMEQLVRNSGAYKSFVATKDEVVANLERDNVKLQNEIVGLKEELEHTKADKDKRAKRVQYLLQEGKVSLDAVIEIFGNTGLKKSRTANKAELDDFNWDDVPVDGGEK